ncbi:hypothetical protein H072_8015 [Dactylellina haptotyla CBS 200.50]|uniref:Female-specific protein transformer n=1 Tax=Dactylellina haptotyla (strain CBS 200.50) TaxID=1284197 RepID=S8BSI1_DACHA|nr:hypothetical protein H072_8015 [Dactylellina haptotyla CBS 200.50]
MADATKPSSGIDDAYAAASAAKKGKLKLKSKRRSHRHNDGHRRHRSRTRSRSRSRTRSRSASPISLNRKKRKQPTVTETDDPSLYDDVYLPGQNSFKYKDPEAAFQESLFEAMADDDGAAYWEGVYGQPIHNYSRPRVENEKGELEMMNDEEYATYVRQRMYEKTDEYLEKEKKRVKKEREREKRKEEEERIEWERRERDRLYREKERRQRKNSERTQIAWAAYIKAWEDITKKDRREGHRVEVPWPVESGRRRDISKDAIESFFKAAPTLDTATDEKKSYTDILRLERVRWHPDKALQRWGRDQMSEEILQGITAVFQIIDALWNEERAGDKR